ncbi:MAG: EAL domain-containing response regulator [Cyanobacteria bacterium P01_C01_bin.118]
MSKTPIAQTTILVIDDDADLAAVFCEGLRLHGFTTLSASTGQAGIQLAQQQQPQLIVCDIRLPDISGYKVLKNLRSHPTTTTIPVIILTGQENSNTFRPSMEQGADDYLNKPIDLSGLLRAIQTQLDKRAQLAQHFAPATNKPVPSQLSTSASWQKLKEQFDHIQQAPWFSLWIIQLQNYGDLYAGYGHILGQLVLQSIRQQLCQWQEQWHQLNVEVTLTYLGKDQFVAFLHAPEPMAEANCKTAVETLQNSLQQPLIINNHRLIPIIDIKAIPYPQVTTLESLAMPKSDSLSAINQPSLAEKLRQAIQQDELQLYFQPQVDLTSGQIIGAEALVRWNIPGESPKLPIQFIPVAEENGLMIPLGEWILETALQQLAQWAKLQRSGISMAVNLSAHQFRSRYFIERLISMVETTGVNPIMIDLEFPEHLIIDNLGRAKFLLTELQERGFSTAIDDFSSGSLSHLQYLPVNILKLDKCFVRALHQNRSNQVIVRAIMEMARGLNISTIANGVETARELSILKQLKCQSMQGYLFSPAIKAADFENLLMESCQQDSTLSEGRGFRSPPQTAIKI